MGDASAPYSRLAGVYDELVVDPCFAQWAVFLDRLWADDPRGISRALDVCCGTGRMTIELVDRGIEVVGVDASPEMLERARVLLGPDVPLRLATLPALPVEGPFDVAVSTFDGLNYLTLADLRETFRALARVIRPDGWLVFDLHTDATLAMITANPVIEGAEQGRTFVLTTTVDAPARSAATRIELTAASEHFFETHVQYFHTGDDVTSALTDAGFPSIDVYDEYSPIPATAETMRATWVARRAA